MKINNLNGYSAVYSISFVGVSSYVMEVHNLIYLPDLCDGTASLFANLMVEIKPKNYYYFTSVNYWPQITVHVSIYVKI